MSASQTTTAADGADALSCVDLAALARPGVDVRQWVNNTLARLLLVVPPDAASSEASAQPRDGGGGGGEATAATMTSVAAAERASTALYDGLQRHAHDVASSVEELTAQTIVRLPRTTLELTRMVSDTHALAAQLQNMSAAVQPAVEAEGAAPVRALAEHSRAARTLQYCSDTLDKAARVDAAMARIDAATRRLRHGGGGGISSGDDKADGKDAAAAAGEVAAQDADMADVDATAEAIRDVQRDLAALREVEGAYGEKQRAALARHEKLVEDALEHECASCLRAHAVPRAARLLHTLHTIGRVDAVLQRHARDAVADVVTRLRQQLQPPPQHDAVTLATAAQLLQTQLVPALCTRLRDEVHFACALACRIDAAVADVTPSADAAASMTTTTTTTATTMREAIVAAGHGGGGGGDAADDDATAATPLAAMRDGDAVLSHKVVQTVTTMVELLHEAFAEVMATVLLQQQQQQQQEGGSSSSSDAHSNEALLRCYTAVQAARVHVVVIEDDNNNDNNVDDKDDDSSSSIDDTRKKMTRWRAAVAQRTTVQLVRALSSVLEADDVIDGFVARATQHVAAQVQRTTASLLLPSSAEHVSAVLAAVTAGVRASLRFVPRRTLTACVDAWLPLLRQLLTQLQPPRTHADDSNNKKEDSMSSGAATSPVRLLQHMVVATRVLRPALLTCQTQLDVYMTTAPEATVTTARTMTQQQQERVVGGGSGSVGDDVVAAVQASLRVRLWQPLLTQLDACVADNEQALQQHLLRPVLGKVASYTTLPVWSSPRATVGTSAHGVDGDGHRAAAAAAAVAEGVGVDTARQSALAAYAVGYVAPTQAVRDLGEAIMEIPLAVDALRAEAATLDDSHSSSSSSTVAATREAVTALLDDAAAAWLDDMVGAVARHFVDECVLRVRIDYAAQPREVAARGVANALEQLTTDMAYLRNVLAAVSDDAFVHLDRVHAAVQAAAAAAVAAAAHETATSDAAPLSLTFVVADLLARASQDGDNAAV